MTRIAIAIAVFLLSIPAHAQWVAGGGYQSFSDDVGNGSLTLGAVYGSVAYSFDRNAPFIIVPELRAATGVSDDSLSGFGGEIELDYFVAISIRGQYEFDSNLYAYLAPSYGRVKLSATFGAFLDSASETESGVGAGIGYRFSEKAAGEFSFEDFGGTDVLSIGFRYTF